MPTEAPSGPQHLFEQEQELPSDIGAVGAYVQQTVGNLLERFCVSEPRQVFRMKVAIDEAMINAVKHGNLEDAADPTPEMLARKVHFRLRLYPSDRLDANSRMEVVIQDQGKGFDPAAVPDPYAPENLEKPSGRGLVIMREFAEAQIQPSPQGTKVTLSFTFLRRIHSLRDRIAAVFSASPSEILRSP